MSYSSPLNINLPEAPEASDPKLYNQLVPLYNAIHILNQYLDRVRINTRGSGSELPPWESLQFQNFFWVRAAMPITPGKVITIFKGKGNYPSDSEFVEMEGAILGAGYLDTLVSADDSKKISTNLITGIAQTPAEVGELVQIGIGPAILQVTGIETGTVAYANKAIKFKTGDKYALNKDGAIYHSGDIAYPAFLGIGVADQALFIPGSAYYRKD